MGALIGTKPEGIDQSLVIPELIVYRCYKHLAKITGSSVLLTEKLISDTDLLVDVGPLDNYPMLVVENLIVQRQNVPRFLRKLTSGLYKEKGTILALGAKQLEKNLCGPLHLITVSLLDCYRLDV